MSTVLTIEKKGVHAERFPNELRPIAVDVHIFGNTDITVFVCPPKIWRRYVELSMNIARSFLVQIAESK